MEIDNVGSLDDLNASINRRLFSVTEDMRQGILELSGAVLRNSLFRDLLNKEFAAEGRELQFLVTPMEAVEPHAIEGPGPYCLSFMVEGRNRFRGGRERLRILAPVSPEFDTFDLESIANLPDPELIYAEREAPDAPRGSRLLSRYLISRTVSFPYKTEGLGPELPSGIRPEDHSSVEVRSLGDLLEDLKWETRAQRRVVRTEGNQAIGEDL